jgi:glycosyltransferase involved in cell wall biosynthesis
MVPPLIDVVIPVFNGAATVRSAIESIQRQTLQDIRIIVLDDGSTDETRRIVGEIAAGDARVQLIAQPNRGIVAARNAGLARCEAAFVAWLDADDLALPDRLETQLAYLETHADCVAVSGAVRHVDADGRFLGNISRLRPPDAADPAWAPAIEPYLVQPFLMARRTAMEEVGGYRHVLYAEDSDLFWRLQERGRLHNLDAVLGDYRLHPGSVSARSLSNGRIMALGSQRAAVSALRRQAGRPELGFPNRAQALYAAAGSLADLVTLGCDGLDRGERDHLEIAVAGKLLELTSYRPYELELADCAFIRSALSRHAGRLRPANRAALARSCAGTAARLAHQGLFREAAALAPPTLRPAAAWRLAVRVVLPPPVRGKLRRAIGRDASVELK